MGDAFGLEQAPDCWVVNLSKAVVGAPDGGEGIRECPACGVCFVSSLYYDMLLLVRSGGFMNTPMA